MKIINNILCCPKCRSTFNIDKFNYKCTNKECNFLYPIVNNIPILINESNSIFEINSFIEKEDTTFVRSKDSRFSFKNIINKIIPSINSNFKSEKILTDFTEIIKTNERQNILIIGGSVDGIGMKTFLSLNAKNNNIITDVSFGGDVNIICDCHSLPLLDNSIDTVIIQAVLEHVIDPYQCVNELTRVLKIGGFILSEVPFMQQLHQAPYDFTRFTYLGHRWLFRDYEHIDSGVVCGAGMGLTWSLRGFVKTLFSNSLLQKIGIKLVHILFFWIKYFDFRKQSELRGGFEAASSIYFIGKLSSISINFKELLDYYNERK